MNEKIKTYFDETTEKLRPLMKALATATPFLEVVNTIINLFGRRKRK